MCTSPTASMGNAISRHYNDVIMGTMTSQITGVSIVCLTVCSGEDERKHQSYVSLAYVRGIHQWPVDSLHRGPVTRKMFPFDDVIVKYRRGSRFDVLWCGFWQVDFTHILHVYFISVKMGSVMRGYFHMKLWVVIIEDVVRKMAAILYWSQCVKFETASHHWTSFNTLTPHSDAMCHVS